jgi:hypothetical protein
MKKTYQLHLRIELDSIDKLKKESKEKNITLAELCRLKIRNNHDRLDLLLQKVEKLIQNVTNK